MIGFLSGEVVFSDGLESIIQTPSGVGYQVFYNKVLVEGTPAAIYIAHIVKEDSETLFGFHSLRAKKLFEMLITVKGVGPKTAYNLISNIGVDEIINAVKLDAKSTLTKVPGLGAKGAAQIVLDLAKKIDKVKMYTNASKVVKGGMAPLMSVQTALFEEEIAEVQNRPESATHHAIMNDALMACKELGFKEDKILPLANKILAENLITKPEQLVHLVLKEL